MTERVYDNNGFFKSKSNPIARSGILEYAGSSISPELEQDRIYKVWRPDSELNNPETIESFRLVPWFTRHEMAGDSFTDAEKIGIQGVTGEEVYFDESDKTLKSTIKAFGSALRKLIDKGIKELSIGMTCDWLIESGVTKDGQKYDVIQKNIRGNHLASVKEGRAGKDIAVMDSCEIINFAMDKLDFKVTNEVGTMTIEEILAALKEIKPSLDQMKQIQESLKGLTSESVEEITEDSEDEYKEKAEDQEEEETAEDMEEDKDDKKSAMDTATVKAIVSKETRSLRQEIKKLKGEALDSASIVKAINNKNALAAKLQQHIGAFDHQSMTSEHEIATYGIKKLGIACDAGEELATLKGYIAAKTPTNIVVDSTAKDGKADFKLEDVGL